MSADMIIRSCAPTLAGLKAGNLFSCRNTEEDEIKPFMEHMNSQLNRKGVYIVLMRYHQGSVLIYVYRKKHLETILADEEVRDFLRNFGYEDFRIGPCLDMLRRRLSDRDFPHEIGVFLDYPLDDIRAFIRNKGDNYLCAGYWKAYYNAEEAVKKFAAFRKCTRIYCQSFFEGADIMKLTVAG